MLLTGTDHGIRATAVSTEEWVMGTHRVVLCSVMMI